MSVELAGREVGHLVAEDFLEKSVGGALNGNRLRVKRVLPPKRPRAAAATMVGMSSSHPVARCRPKRRQSLSAKGVTKRN